MGYKNPNHSSENELSLPNYRDGNFLLFMFIIIIIIVIII